MSMLSMVIVPLSWASIRRRERARELFPLGGVSILDWVQGGWRTCLPVRPQMAIFWPGWIRSEML